MSSRHVDFADLMLVQSKSDDYDDASDKILEFVNANYDMTDLEQEHFLFRIQQLVFPDIKPLELSELCKLSYERIIYERKVRRSQGH